VYKAHDKDSCVLHNIILISGKSKKILGDSYFLYTIALALILLYALWLQQT